jgi:hypothetical protein
MMSIANMLLRLVRWIVGREEQKPPRRRRPF